MRPDPLPTATRSAPRELPDTSTLFDKHGIVQRHANLLKLTSVAWALRNRATNGLSEAGAVFEAQSGELLLHEPAFLRWYLGLSGRRKPRASHRSRRCRVRNAN